MTIALWCILAAIIMPYGVTLFAKRRMPLRENKAPRAYKAQLTGASQRAVWAEANHFESIPGFMAAVIVAQMLQSHQCAIDVLALSYLGCRILYTICYITDRSALRSLVWFGGLGCIVGLFITASLTGTAISG